MNTIQILFTFTGGLWAHYANTESLLSEFNAAQLIPEPEDGEEQQAPFELRLTDAERSLIDRAITTQGQSYPIDLERLRAEHDAVVSLRFYQSKADGVVIDGDTLAELGYDLTDYDETIATENAWHKVNFIRQQMDPQILAELDTLQWPSFLLLLKLYRVLHLQKQGSAFSLTNIASAVAAEKAAKEAELAEKKAASKTNVVADQ